MAFQSCKGRGLQKGECLSTVNVKFPVASSYRHISLFDIIKTLYLNKEALHTPGFSRLVSLCISLTHHTMGSGLSHKLKDEPAWKAWGCEICLPLVTLGYLSLPLLTLAYLCLPYTFLCVAMSYWALLVLIGHDLTGSYWAFLGGLSTFFEFAH